jgi:hypothetical protein
MEQETEYSGVLFGNIKYSSDEQIESIINNMEYQQAIFFLTKAERTEPSIPDLFNNSFRVT